MGFLEGRTSEEVMSCRGAAVTVVNICISRVHIGREGNIAPIDRGALVIPRSEGTNDIMRIVCLARAEGYIFAIYESFCCEALVSIFAPVEKVACAGFTVDVVCSAVNSLLHKGFYFIVDWFLDFL